MFFQGVLMITFFKQLFPMLEGEYKIEARAYIEDRVTAFPQG